MAKTRTRHDLNAEERQSLPDSAYAFPRVRKEPLNDATHVRNAIARFDQVRDVTDEERKEAFRRIRRAADKHGVEMSATRWQELGKPTPTTKSSEKPHTPTKAERAALRRGDAPRDVLYAEARRQGIKGRSTMSKADLQRALQKG
jgi:acyl-CoA reductase-like NAD-dependent aldehyde dehydrogenase